jgi:hypothetical protein
LFARDGNTLRPSCTTRGRAGEPTLEYAAIPGSHYETLLFQIRCGRMKITRRTVHFLCAAALLGAAPLAGISPATAAVVPLTPEATAAADNPGSATPTSFTGPIPTGSTEAAFGSVDNSTPIISLLPVIPLLANWAITGSNECIMPGTGHCGTGG